MAFRVCLVEEGGGRGWFFPGGHERRADRRLNVPFLVVMVSRVDRFLAFPLLLRKEWRLFYLLLGLTA